LATGNAIAFGAFGTVGLGLGTSALFASNVSAAADFVLGADAMRPLLLGTHPMLDTTRLPKTTMVVEMWRLAFGTVNGQNGFQIIVYCKLIFG
jgi:hypothetical protein